MEGFGKMKRLFLGILHFYRKYISPMKKPCCRYYPTCSSYAVEAIEKHGAVKGGYLAVRRVCRCHPFHEGGIDPVPEKFTLYRNSFNKKQIQIGGK
jgi:putative membrane protein insertion efficiency factor